MNDKNNDIDIYIKKGMIHNKEMEQSVLSAFLSQTQSYMEYKDILTEDCFYDEQTRAIYKAIKEVALDGRIPDMFVVASNLAKNGSSITSSDLAKMVFNCPSNPDTYAHVMLLRDYGMRRNLWKIGYNLISQSVIESYSVASIHGEAKKNIDSLFDNEQSELRTLEDSYKELQCKMIENSQMPEGSISGTSTGFEELDTKGGLCEGDLVVVGAETSQGKTSFATAIAVNAISNGDKVAFYSMEMTTLQLTARIASMRSGISSTRILNDKLSSEEIFRVDEAMAGIDCSGMFFDERSTSSLDSLLMSIRAMHSKYGIKGAGIDYLQLVNNLDKNRTVEQFTADCARAFKNLAKELNIWIIVISQLSRNPQNPLPTKSRLRNSGQIEEAADVILLIYRPEGTKFNYPEPFQDITTKGTAMVIIDKNRNGEKGNFICGFNGANTLFYPLDRAQINDLRIGNDITSSFGDIDPNNPNDQFLPF